MIHSKKKFNKILNCICLELGYRYEWDRTYLTVNKSDWVTWTWQPPVTVSGLKYKIEQVQGANSIEPNGFSSGDSVEYGTFKYQFHTPGIYYYWSGFVDINQQIFFRGVVEVLDGTNLEKEFEIDLKLNEISGFFFNFFFIEFFKILKCSAKMFISIYI